MSDQLYDAVARIARHETSARSWAAIGVVTEVHTGVLLGDDHAVTVELRDDRTVVPRLPIAVGALGFAATPTVDDLVVIVFAGGDRHAGVVVGRLYHRDLPPPPHDDGQLVLQLPPGSPSPDIDVVADPNAPELVLKVGQSTVAVRGRTATITIGDAELVVDGDVPATVSVTAGDSSLVLDARGDIALESTKSIELKAPEIVLKADGKVSISGGIVEMN